MGVKRKFCWSRMEVLLVRKGTLLNHIGQFREYRWSGRGEVVHIGRKWKFFSFFGCFLFFVGQKRNFWYFLLINIKNKRAYWTNWTFELDKKYNFVGLK